MLWYARFNHGTLHINFLFKLVRFVPDINGIIHIFLPVVIQVD